MAGQRANFPPSPAQLKRAGEDWRCLPAAPTQTMRRILLCFHRFQTHPAIHPSYARWLDASLCGQSWHDGIWHIWFPRIHVGSHLSHRYHFTEQVLVLLQ